MKKNYYFICLLFISIFCINKICFAGNEAGSISLTLSDAYYAFNDKRNLDNTTYPNVFLSYNFNKRFAIEAGAGVLSPMLKAQEIDKTLNGSLYNINAIYRFFPCGHFEPYITGGIGLLSLNFKDNESNYPGNINLGLGAQVFWGYNIAMRFEARDIYQTTGGAYNDYLINFGVSFLFGGCDSVNYK
ncbi:porin family protein [Gammaproteobacteria bacterium]|nr:porin family protein [Gammaproteobacteria bacterium]